MNYLLKTVFFILICNTSTLAQETCDADAKPKTDSQRIKEKIFCKYDKNIRPGFTSQNQTRVSIFISPVTIQFVEQSASLRLQAWIELFWSDEKFKWNYKDYKNTSVILIDADKVWLPDVSLANWKERVVHVDKICSTVIVGHEGYLYTSTIPILSGHCVPNWTKWPFDIQNCEVHLTSRQYMGNEVDFILAAYDGIHQGLYMEDFIPSREWQLIDYKAERFRTDYGSFNDIEIFRVDIKIFLSIKRHASVLISSYIMPGFVMMLLSLSVLWFNPSTSQRIPIICVLVLLQSLFLQYLAYKIPSNGAKTPGIVIFYGGSLILTTILLLLTMLTRSMNSWTMKPSWLSSFLNLLRTNSTIQFILITDLQTYSVIEDEEGSTQHSEKKGEKEWQELAFVINRVAFIIFLPIYIILFIHFIV